MDPYAMMHVRATMAAHTMLHVRASLGSADSQNSSRSHYTLSIIDEEELVKAAASVMHAAGRRLNKEERQQTLQAALEHGEEALLQRIKHRLDRCGFDWPGVDVSYTDLSVTRRAVSSTESLPSLFSPLAGLLPHRRTSSSVKALDGATGVLRAGSLTLVLGPPASGRSTLLKVLAGRLWTSSMVDISGGDALRYNGQSADTFVLQRTAVYVDQIDRLMPTLTTRETLNFAETCAGPSRHLDEAMRRMMAWEAAHPEEATRTELDDEADKMLLRMLSPGNLLQSEYMLRVLGLAHVGDTVVGDAMLRGVSGGEKRRVAVGEGLVTPAMILCLDEASTGLDSASTLALVRSMRRSAKLLNATVVMALLQPEPEVVAEFDDVILLAEGKVLWHGPPAAALRHFSTHGFQPAPGGQDTAEFLLALTSPADQGTVSAAGGVYVPPAQLSKWFWESQAGVELRAAATAEVQPSSVQLQSLDKRRRGAPWHVLLRACATRLFKVDLARNWEACAIRWMLALLMAVIMGVLFLQLPVSFVGGTNLLGMLFQGLFFLQMLSLPSIEVTFEKRPILFQQRDDLLYPAWVEWLPAVLLNLPILVVDTLVFGTPIYFLIGFTASASAFFTFLLIFFCFSLLCDNIYRVYGSASKVLSFAIGIGVCQGIVHEMLAGFVITPGSIPPYWAWYFWINPVAYAFRAVAVNEFKQARWQVPAGAPGTPGADQMLGESIMEFFQIDATWSWVWGGAGVLLAMAAFCGAAALLAYTFNKMPEHPAIIAPQPASAAGVSDDDDMALQKQQQEGCAPVQEGVTTAAAAGPAAGITIAFKDLCYYVPSSSGKGSELQLLHNITGCFRPGVLSALMGSSGAGKTTALDVIAGRKTAGRITGTICVDGHPQSATRFARLVGYVEQADIHMPLATVQEALLFSAALRTPPGPGRARLAATVDHVLRQVELTQLSGMLIGTAGVDGLSTEQRKRLTIAVELVASPRALFMDEPTSGLDTRSAALIAGVMRHISRMGVTIVATIHQPSVAIFSKFDELLLLKRGGHTVFFGPLGPGACHLVDHFQAVPEAPRFQQGRNPAAWMLDVVGGPAALLPGYPDLVAHWSQSALAKAALVQVEALCQPPKDAAGLDALNPPAPTNSLQQLGALLQRGYRGYWRSPHVNFNRFIITVVVALIIGSIEWGKGSVSKIHEARDVQNALGAMFMVATALAVEVGFECQSGIAKERVVYYRERAAACYGAGPYLASQVLVELSYVSVQTIIYTVITFFMVKFELSATNFGYVLVLVWLNCFTSFLMSQALVQTTPVVFIATTLYSVVSNLQGLTSGFTRPLPSAHPAWRVAYSLNPQYYSFIGLGSMMLGGVRGTTIPDPSVGGGAVVSVGDYVTSLYGMGQGAFPGPYGSLGMLAALGCVAATASFVGLRFGNFQSR